MKKNQEKLKEELLELYRTEFEEIKIPNPSETAGNLLNEAIKLAGEFNIPPNAGDSLLEKEKGNKDTKRVLDKRRKEGVTNKDIEWWWNLDNLERAMLLKVDEFFRMALYIKCRREDSLSVEEAIEQVRKYHPIYGDPGNTTHTKGDDRPIPEELKDRVNKYIKKRFKDNQEKYKKDIEKSSTFNALIRKEIKSGNL